MLSKESMQEIQDLKLRGYSQSEIVDYYIQRGKKPPSRPTIRKYYEMNECRATGTQLQACKGLLICYRGITIPKTLLTVL